MLTGYNVVSNQIPTTKEYQEHPLIKYSSKNTQDIYFALRAGAVNVIAGYLSPPQRRKVIVSFYYVMLILRSGK